MREQVRLEYEMKYTAERNYAQMMNIYELVLNLSARQGSCQPACPGLPWNRSLLIEFSSAVLLTSFFAGLLGALTGLGGGVVIVPALALLFHVDLRYAIGASLISVIATSSGAAVAYVREGFSNVRIGMFLEVATTLGAVGGAYLAARVSTPAIGIIFGVTLLYSAWSSFREPAQRDPSSAQCARRETEAEWRLPDK